MAKRKTYPGQLDLFEWQQPSTVIALPITAWGRTLWAHKVEKAAGYIVEETPDMADRIWDGVCYDVEQTLLGAGATEEQARLELLKFRRELTAAVLRQGHAELM